MEVEAHWYEPRKCYRVWIPVRLSENGKRYRRFFATKEQAQKFIFETKRSGSVELAELAVDPRADHSVAPFPSLAPYPSPFSVKASFSKVAGATCPSVGLALVISSINIVKFSRISQVRAAFFFGCLDILLPTF
jgi:hypothetical protein